MFGYRPRNSWLLIEEDRVSARDPSGCPAKQTPALADAQVSALLTLRAARGVAERMFSDIEIINSVPMKVRRRLFRRSREWGLGGHSGR